MAEYRIVPKGSSEDTLHFTVDMTPMNDDNQRDITVRHGGDKRVIVLSFDDVVDAEGNPDLQEIHIDATGFPADQLAFVLHETSHMLAESSKEDELQNLIRGQEDG